MWEMITSTVSSHWTFYVEQVKYQWQHMTPTKYAGLLIFVFVFGWFLLKSNMKKP